MGSIWKLVFEGICLSDELGGGESWLSLSGDLRWASALIFRRYNAVIGTWDQLGWDKRENRPTTCLEQVFSVL